MIGLGEIIFSLIMFMAIWFTIFKFVMIYQGRKKLKKLVEKIEKQDKEVFIDGKKFDIKEALGLDKSKSTPVQEKPKEIKEEKVLDVPMKMKKVFPYGDVPVVDSAELKKQIKEDFKK